MIIECDVLVVGAGMAGVGVAAELATDRRVILLEQENHPGTHATGRSAALHAESYGNTSIRMLTRASREFFLNGGKDVTFATNRGCLYIATENQLERLDEFEARPGVAAAGERVGPIELRALLPALLPGVVAALFDRNTYDLDVDAIQSYFLSRLREAGGALYCNTGVSALAHDGTAWTVSAGERRFRAPIIVNAAGAWGDVVAQLAGVTPIGLEPRRRTALLVDPAAGVDPSSWPAVIDVDEQFYFKPEAGKILLSPADETLTAPCDAYPEDLDIAIAVDRVQQVADIPVHRVSHSWAGLRTFAPDRTPVVGFDGGAPGFFWLVGQGGYGIQTAPALSRLAASLVRDAGVPLDLMALGIERGDLSPARFGNLVPSAAL